MVECASRLNRQVATVGMLMCTVIDCLSTKNRVAVARSRQNHRQPTKIAPGSTAGTSCCYIPYTCREEEEEISNR